MTEEQLLIEYNNGSEELKQSFRRMYDENIFIKRFKKPKPEWIQLWDKFCLENDLNIHLPHAHPKTSEEEYDNASMMLRHIVKIRTNNWIPNWDNESEKKFYPRFDMRTHNGGSSFGFTYYVIWYSDSSAGSRLCFPNAVLCEKTIMEFLPIYEKFIK